MISEALQRLQKLAADANGVMIVKPPAESPHVYGVLAPGATSVEWRTAATPPLASTAMSIAGLVAGLGVFCDPDEPHPMVWYSRAGIVAVLDRNDRRDTVTLPLHYSEPMKALLNWDKSPTAMDSRQLVLLLRTVFRQSLDMAGDLIDIVRNVRWSQEAGGETNVGHGKQSIGKTLAAQITGVSALPEYVRFNVPVFNHAELAFRFPIECALEPDAGTQSFKLIPIPGETERALAFAEAETATKLIAELKQQELGTVQIVHGQPK